MSRYIVFAFLTFVLTTKSFGAFNNQSSPPKIILVVIDAEGKAHIGRDTLFVAELAAELQKRLWKSYMGTGKMYDSIKVEFEGQVLMGTRGAAMDAIQSGQKKALTDLCLEKHKKLFDDLNASQQNKLRKQFPVLFQSTYQ